MGIQAKAGKGRAQLRKGEIKRNLRIKKRKEESKQGALLVPLAPTVELVSRLTAPLPQPQENLVPII